MINLIHSKKIRVYVWILCILNLYILLHTLFSGKGFIEYLKLRNKYRHTAAELEYISTENQKLRSRLEVMNPKMVNMDYLEELARKEFGYTEKSETLVIYEKSKL